LLLDLREDYIPRKPVIPRGHEPGDRAYDLRVRADKNARLVLEHAPDNNRGRILNVSVKARTANLVIEYTAISGITKK